MISAVRRLIGTVVVVVLSAGISTATMTRADSRKATVPRGVSGAKGIQELLDFIYQCRGCDGDREGRNNSNPAFAPGGGAYQALVMELSSAAASARQIWIATNPGSALESAANTGAGGMPARQFGEPTHTIAYLGGISDNFASSAWGAFGGRNHGRGGDSEGFGHKPDSLAAVPEPAPIFLLGTILLATFSIARLRFNR